MFLKYIILNNYGKMQTERTISNVYHLLNGRRSIQTIQDAHLYQLKKYYGIYKTFSKQEFDSYIKELVSDGFLQQIEETYLLTDSADNWLATNEQLESNLFFKGHAYNAFQHTFYARFLLLTQVWVNSKMHNRSYIPVIEDDLVERWVKRYYIKTKQNITRNLNALFGELNDILQTVGDEQAGMFVDRMTGYKHFGKSIEQLAIKYKLTKHDVHLNLMSVIHKLIHMSNRSPVQYPQSYALFSDLLTSHSISHSSRKTRDFLRNGLSVGEIAAVRRLAKNTIYDHIVEIALNTTGFPYEQFVTTDQTLSIFNVMNQLKTYRLKEIKQHLPEEITYFQIRLVLTQLNREEGVHV